MRTADIPLALRLSSKEGWATPRRDFERVLQLNPRGSFIALYGSKKVGLATTIVYGRRSAWIGNVVVDKRFRGLHIGQALVDHCVQFLRKSRIRHIGLYCFNNNVRFYEKLGFVKNAEFLRLARHPASKTSPNNHEAFRHRKLLRSVLAADKKAFGLDRSGLIQLFLTQRAGWYLTGLSADDRTSYLFVKEYRDGYEIGPWVSAIPRSEPPEGLLPIALKSIGHKRIEVSCLRRNLRTLAALKTNGFRTINEGCRMYYDESPCVGEDAANYALGFLDKG